MSDSSPPDTERLVLREQTMGDLDELAAILGDAQTMSFYPRPYTRAEASYWIQRNMERYGRGVGLWAMVLREDGRFIGQCGLSPQEVEGVSEIEVGWHVNRSLWRRGYASEAAASCRNHAFGKLGVTRLVSLIRPENVASARVARKIGMKAGRRILRGDMVHIVYFMEQT